MAAIGSLPRPLPEIFNDTTSVSAAANIIYSILNCLGWKANNLNIGVIQISQHYIRLRGTFKQQDGDYGYDFTISEDGTVSEATVRKDVLR